MNLAVLLLALTFGASPAEPISLDLKDADLVDVLRYFAEISDLNMVLDPGVRGSVTLRVIDVPWTSAFDLVLATHGLAFELEADANLVRVAPRQRLIEEARARQQLEAERLNLAPLVTFFVPVSYAEPRELARLLEATVLSPRGSVSVFESQRLLVVREVDEPERLRRIRATAAELDR